MTNDHATGWARLLDDVLGPSSLLARLLGALEPAYERQLDAAWSHCEAAPVVVARDGSTPGDRQHSVAANG